jgi:hypothetical protein
MRQPSPVNGHDTVAQLKADIDAGRTGDKVANADPALSPLGTDDEAAGTPPGPEAVALARKTEAKPFEPVRDTRSTPGMNWLLPLVIAAIALVIVGFVWWMRR